MVKGSEPPCFLFILGTISLVPFFHLLKFKYLKIEFISRLTGGATPHQTLKTNTVWWSILRRHPTNLHSNLFYFFLQNIYFFHLHFSRSLKIRKNLRINSKSPDKENSFYRQRNILINYLSNFSFIFTTFKLYG